MIRPVTIAAAAAAAVQHQLHPMTNNHHHHQWTVTGDGHCTSKTYLVPIPTGIANTDGRENRNDPAGESRTTGRNSPSARVSHWPERNVFNRTTRKRAPPDECTGGKTGTIMTRTSVGVERFRVFTVQNRGGRS